MYVPVLRPYRKDTIYFRTIEEREKINGNNKTTIKSAEREFRHAKRVELKINMDKLFFILYYVIEFECKLHTHEYR